MSNSRELGKRCRFAASSDARSMQRLITQTLSRIRSTLQAVQMWFWDLPDFL
jgi:hypothetical protein